MIWQPMLGDCRKPHDGDEGRKVISSMPQKMNVGCRWLGVAFYGAVFFAFAMDAPAEDFDVQANVRVYFESAYLSSGGSLTYTRPLAEQSASLLVQSRNKGRLSSSAWICSALNDQTDAKHRRAFYIYEGTLLYGYDVNVAEKVKLSTDVGILWDWLGGYESRQHTPLAWYARQYLHNPWVTPYWIGLGCLTPTTNGRMCFGLRKPFKPADSFTVTPYAETTWGDVNRFRSNYGNGPDHHFLGGAFMFAVAGVVAEWRFTENWYLWGRYRQYMLYNKQARGLIDESDLPTAKKSYPIFGLGLGCRF